jgi:hypothetical protein
MAKALIVRPSGLYATKLRYGGHERDPYVSEISKFANYDH